MNSQLMDVLIHHGTDEYLIRREMENEKKKLQADLEELYSILGIKAIVYQADKIQSSADPDAKLVAVMDKIQIRRDLYAISSERLQRKLNTIHGVKACIMDLPVADRNLLLALYYPRATYIEAARILGYDRSYVVRHRVEAIEKLESLCISRKIL